MGQEVISEGVFHEHGFNRSFLLQIRRSSSREHNFQHGKRDYRENMTPGIANLFIMMHACVSSF